MSSSVDERVVNLELRSQQFVRNTGQAIRAIGELQQALNFNKTNASLKQFQSAANHMEFGGMESTLQKIANKFTGLGITGLNVLNRISNMAINTATNLARMFTIQPIFDGFQEYQTQMNAIQTIWSNTKSKGTTLDDVNSALDELNEYADLTIYNFTEMTRNIGTFTAAGVDLDKSVQGIKGIANLAAISGSSSMQASNAMYQLSQAIATGTVHLMDWNSVVNAGMGGEMFQKQLIQTARVHGVAIDAIIKKSGSFRESLSKDWLTSEILLETLGQFAGEYSEEQLKQMGYNEEQIKQIIQLGEDATAAATEVKTISQLFDTLREAAGSGWTTSWRLIVGDFAEAKTMLTDISNYFSGILNKTSQARNNMLTLWKKMGGRDAGIEIIKNAWNGLLSVIIPIRDAFDVLIPKINGRELAMGMKQIAKFTENMKLSEEDGANLATTLRGLANVIKLLVDIIAGGISVIARFVSTLAPLVSVVLDFTAEIGTGLSVFTAWVRNAEGLSTVFEKIDDVINRTRESIKNFTSGADGVAKGFQLPKINLPEMKTPPFLEKFGEMMSGWGTEIQNGISGIVEKIRSGVPDISEVIGALGVVMEKMSPIFERIGTFLSNFDVMDLATILNPIFLMSMSGGLKAFLDNISTSIKNITTGIPDLKSAFQATMKEGLNTLKAWQTELKAEALMHIAKALILLAASLTLLSLIDPIRMSIALGGVSVLLGELVAVMIIIDKMAFSINAMAVMKLVMMLESLAAAVLLLTIPVVVLSNIEWQNLIKGLVGLTAMMAILVGAAKGMSLISARIKVSALAMIELGIAVNVLVSAVKGLASLSVEGMIQGLVGVGAILAELVAFQKFASFKGLGFISGTGLLMMASSLKILETSVTAFAKMDSDALLQGLAAVAALLTEIAVFSQFSGGAFNFAGVAIGMNLLAVALLMLGDAMKVFSGMSLQELGIGLAGFAGTMAAIVLAFKFMPKNFMMDSAALAGVGFAFKDLAKALVMFGSLKPEQLAIGLAGLGGSLAIIAVGMRAMTGALPGAAALVVVAAGLALFVPEMIALSAIPWQGLLVGLAALAGAFAIFGAAGALLGPVLPVILGLSVAILAFGAGVALAGEGTLMFAGALAELALTGGAGANAFMYALSTILSGLPLLAGEIAGVIKLFATIIIVSSPVIIGAIEKVITDILAMLVRISPQVNEAFFRMIVDFLRAGAEAMPEINQFGYEIVLELMRGIRDHIEEITELGIDIISEFLEGVNNSMPELNHQAVECIITFANSMSDEIDEHSSELGEAFFNLGVSLFMGLADGLTSGFATAGDKIKELGGKVINRFTGKDGGGADTEEEFKEAGKDCVQGVADGVTENSPIAEEASEGLAKRMLNKFQGFLKIHSPSIVMNEQGHYIVQGVAEGIKEDTSAEDAARQKAQNIVNAFKTEIDKLDLSTSTANLQYQLWEAVSSLELTKRGGEMTAAEEIAYNMEYNARELTYLTTQLGNQQKEVTLAYDKWQEMVRYFGESATESQEAFNAYLQAQIDYTNTAQQVEQINQSQIELQKQGAENIRQRERAYNDYIQKYSDLIGKGFTKEEIEAAAREKTGFDPRQITTDMDTYVTQAMGQAMGTVQSAYSVAAASTMGAMTTDFTNYGANYAIATASGMTENTPNVTEAAVEMVTGSANAIKDKNGLWRDAAKNLCDVFIEGIRENIQKVANQAAAMATQAYQAAMNAIGADTSGMGEAVSTIASGIGDTWAISSNPVITPVVDMSNVDRAEKQIQDSFRKMDISTAVTTTKAKQASSLNSSREHPSERGESQTVVNQNFTQNNYSPKALSKTEIYRQTKNQFSTLKGANA